MKIKWGAFVVAGRGSAGGTVASRNTYGTYFRNKVTPINPKTVAQQLVRQFMALISQSWKGITQVQRDVWNSTTASFQATDIFGDSFSYTGFNLFMRLNRNLLEINEAPIDDAPKPVSVFGFTELSLAVDITLATLIATFAGAIDADTKVIVTATAPQSAGKSFVKSEYRKIAVLDSADVTPKNLETEYIAKFGSLGSAGSKIFIQFKPISIATGQPGTTLSASAIST